jgi:predicted metal-dependent peptidase
MTKGNGKPLSPAEEALRQAIIKDKVNKAISAAKGNIPQGLEGIIASLNRPAQVNWKQQLRNLIASSRCITTRPNRMKVHRRFELDQPGKTKKRKLVLGVCTDSSGSVSDAAYAEFLNEIHSIAKNTTITSLVHADCVVQKVDIIKGGKPKGDVLKKRHGSGGTAYGPAIEHCMKLGCDAIAYMGDGDASDVPKDPKVPFIWVLVGNSPPPASFGRVIRINEG